MANRLSDVRTDITRLGPSIPEYLRAATRRKASSVRTMQGYKERESEALSGLGYVAGPDSESTGGRLDLERE